MCSPSVDVVAFTVLACLVCVCVCVSILFSQNPLKIICIAAWGRESAAGRGARREYSCVGFGVNTQTHTHTFWYEELIVLVGK